MGRELITALQAIRAARGGKNGLYQRAAVVSRPISAGRRAVIPKAVMEIRCPDRRRAATAPPRNRPMPGKQPRRRP